MSEWISVKERLPQGKGECLVVYDLNPKIDMTEFGKFLNDRGKMEQGFCSDGDIWVNVTHWMPLPEPPKEKPESTATPGKTSDSQSGK